MNELTFWKIIEQSKEESIDFLHQVDLIINKLSSLEENRIVEFEYRFREILSKSAQYNIMGAAKVVNGYVSDDNFLYFRCRLIAEGMDLYYSIIENPDVIGRSNISDLGFRGEEMLYISDRAFIAKNKGNTNLELPRDIAFDYYNYDEGEKIEGEDWDEENLPLMYPELWKKYKESSS